MTNIGGDYWEVTHAFPEGTNLEVQYYATDWEGVGNTAFTATNDTVLPLRYYKRGFDDPPYTPSDSVDVWFRVNVGGVVGFDPATQQVGIRGSFLPFDWGTSYLLAREGTSMFYSGVAKFDPDSARNVYYKFYIENGAGWEPSGDNIFSMKNDTTMYGNGTEVYARPINLLRKKILLSKQISLHLSTAVVLILQLIL